MNPSPNEGIRLNKYLASCGVASRRGADALIKNREVLVNGEICDKPSYRVQADDQVRACGKRLEQRREESIVFHKPAGLVCSRHDEEGKNTIYDLLPGRLHHLMHVGRLDMESEGLLILSNDGALTQALTHPKHNVQKLYHVTMEQAFENHIIDLLEKGVYSEEIGKVKAHSVKRLSSRRLAMVLVTGKKRQIRYMIQAVHHRVKRLTRLKIGPLELGELKPGKWRPLTPQERADLMEAAS